MPRGMYDNLGRHVGEFTWSPFVYGRISPCSHALHVGKTESQRPEKSLRDQEIPLLNWRTSFWQTQGITAAHIYEEQTACHW